MVLCQKEDTSQSSRLPHLPLKPCRKTTTHRCAVSSGSFFLLKTLCVVCTREQCEFPVSSKCDFARGEKNKRCHCVVCGVNSVCMLDTSPQILVNCKGTCHGLSVAQFLVRHCHLHTNRVAFFSLVAFTHSGLFLNDVHFFRANTKHCFA